MTRTLFTSGRRWLIGAALFVSLSGELMAREMDCPDFPEPKARVQWVAPYMIYNGVPMSVKRFDSEQKPADVLAFYRQAWSAATASAAPLEYTVDPWQTIAVVRGKCFFTVQVQAAGNNGSTGLLSATQAPDQTRIISSDKALPMMSGSTIINDIEHRDDGKTARTLLLSNSFSAETNAGFYRQTLGDQGWQAVNSYQMTTKNGPGITLIMKRGLAEANLVITRSGSSTNVLANLVDKP
ncbi:MAG: hypothetical protein JWQ21_3476 [Herminiimonas sp.]|nr:hypothetical protein [Herminiimonas sp.]